MWCSLCKKGESNKQLFNEKWVPMYHHLLLNLHWVFVPTIIYSLYNWLNYEAGSKLAVENDSNLSYTVKCRCFIL